MEKLLTTTEAAAALGGLSKSTMEKWRTAKVGPKFVRIGKRVFYRESDLGRYIEAQTDGRDEP